MRHLVTRALRRIVSTPYGVVALADLSPVSIAAKTDRPPSPRVLGSAGLQSREAKWVQMPEQSGWVPAAHHCNLVLEAQGQQHLNFRAMSHDEEDSRCAALFSEDQSCRYIWQHSVVLVAVANESIAWTRRPDRLRRG